MPKKIDHEERKIKILNTALKVFAREGYKDSNLSMIAEECGVSRPTLYLYFKDKDDIYYYAVKLVTGHMFQKYSVMAWDESIGDQIDRIIAICTDIIDYAMQNIDSLEGLMDIMLQLKRENVDFSETIMKRTIKLTILFKRLLNSGMQEKVVSPDCDVDMVSTHIFTLLECFCFQVAFLGNFDPEESKRFVSTYLGFFRVKKDK